MDYPRLMSPIRLGCLELRNRLVMAPMLSRLVGPLGSVSPQLLDYYAARADGGAGAIIIEYAYIDRVASQANAQQLGAYGDELGAGLAELAEVIKEREAKAILQICHAGRCANSKVIGRQPIAPSPAPTLFGEAAREMTMDEIEQVGDAFAEAAFRARRAGFDGVEIHATHGYLLAQFSSPHFNVRPDRYGQDRALFLLEVLKKVRSRVEDDFVVGYRISGEEYMKDGVDLEGAKALAKRLEKAGVNYLHVSGGLLETSEDFIPPLYLPGGRFIRLAEGVRSVVNVPVIAVGAIHDAAAAEAVVADGKADLIALGRALIADPEYPAKLAAGQPEKIRPCIRCNEGCLAGVHSYSGQRCVVNAEAGRERRMRLQPAPASRRVCVVGGGPAGLETARVLALRGHQVVLAEAEPQLGGLLRFAGVPSFKTELTNLLDYLVHEVGRLDVDVRLSQPVTSGWLDDLDPHEVVIATGSSFRRPNIPGAASQNVVWPTEILGPAAPAGQEVVIVGGAAMGCEIALHLESQGRKVTLVEMVDRLASDLSGRTRDTLIDLISGSTVKVLRSHRLLSIADGRVMLAGPDLIESEKWADLVVMACGLQPNRELAVQLASAGRHVHLIGDCVRPRKLNDAIHEGSFVGRVL